MMKYKNFYFENYKGIKERLEFNLNTDAVFPHCILGNNESGKTTILKGIELIGKLCEGNTIQNGERKAIKPKGDYFSGIVKLGATLIAEKEDVEEGSILSKYLKSTENEFIISLSFSYEFKRSSFVENSNKVEINFDGSLVTAKDDIKAIFDLIKQSAPDLVYYDDFKFMVPKAIRFIESGKSPSDPAYLNSPENKHWQQIFDDILKGHDSKAASFQKDVVDWYKDANNDPSIADSRLRNMGKYLDKVLEEWIDNKDNNIGGFEVSKKQPEKEEDKQFNDYQIRIISGVNSYEMNERSKGLQWSFCFHILTKIRQNRHGAGFIFLLDEPANNLHIRPQKQMLEHLKGLCKDNSAVIYTTHAPELIGIEKECYEYTFIAKNKAGEFDTDIRLYGLTEPGLDVDIQDLEPILAKLAYEDVKSLSDDKPKNDKQKWKSILKNIKEGLPIASQTSTIANFGLTLSKFFGH